MNEQIQKQDDIMSITADIKIFNSLFPSSFHLSDHYVRQKNDA